MGNSIFDLTLTTLQGKPYPLQMLRGKLLLIVNTASACGFTPQYSGLEALQQKYQAQGLQVLGMPCNQFGRQEPGAPMTIETFCRQTYGVTFPLMMKCDVNGKNTHPLFAWLKHQAPGWLGSRAIKWNFTKFLVARDGQQVQRFAPQTPPAHLEQAIQAWL